MSDFVQISVDELARLRGIETEYQRLTASVFAPDAKQTPVTDDSDPSNAPWIVVEQWPAPMLFFCHVRGWRALAHEATPYLDYSEAVDEAEQQQAFVVPLRRVQP